MTEPVLIRVSFISVVGTELLEYPVILNEEGVAVHVKRVLLTDEVNAILVLVLLQMYFLKVSFDRSGNESIINCLTAVSQHPSVE